MYYRGDNNEIIEAYGSDSTIKDNCTTTPKWLTILLIILLILVLIFVIYNIINKNKKL